MASLAALISTTAVSVLVIAALAQDAPQSYKSSPFLRMDPDKVTITDATASTPCGECHTQEREVWMRTKHATGFETMHKSESANDILTNMGLRVAKRQEAICMRCHYTVGPERKAIAGVSCESCHGPARDWVNVHNKWGGGARDRAEESPEARSARITASRAAGMLRPSTDLYGVAANCFECHTVPIEDLVNKGQHKAGSSGFELVRRVDSIRHNFLGSAKNDPTNQPISKERARLMFVVGRMLAYEYSLRGLANATTAGQYARSMERRVQDASRGLDEIARTASIPSVAEILRIGAKLKLVPNNRRELEAAADNIRKVGERFVAGTTVSPLVSLDALIAGPSATPVVAAAPEPAATPATGTKNAAATPSAATPVAKTSAAAAALPGQIRDRPSWYNKEGHSGMVEAGECANCHGDADEKMTDGAHQRASQRLTGENAKARRIAELYGIGAGARARPDQICMSCHATVDEATKTVQPEGVTCEGCHGGGAQYLEPHKKGGNPQLGMRSLKQAAARAQLCYGCHRISDERLLAAGHPDGTKKDLVALLDKIKHWPGAKPEKARQKRGQSYPVLTDDALRAAFAAEAAKRAIPKVTVVAAPASSAPARSAPAPSATAPVSRSVAVDEPAKPARSSVPPPVATALLRPVTSGNVSLDIPPLPTADSLTTEELLLLLKQRVERINAAIRRGNP